MTCVFTAFFDIAENVFVVVQVAVEDEEHGELRKDKTQLVRKREDVHSCSFVLFLQPYKLFSPC